MGSTNFTNEYRGPGDMEEAYAELVSEALHERGHEPYNGTISTTHGCVQDPAVTFPITAEAAYRHLGIGPDESEAWWDRDEQPQKWQEAWAIPLMPELSEAESSRFRPDRTQPGWLFYGWAAC